MPYTHTSPNMNLILPDVGVQLGPTWAANLDTAFFKIDSHNHTSSNGVKVPTAGILIDEDLDFHQNNIVNLRSLKLLNSISTLPDTVALYSSSGNLFYNNALGIPIQLTQGSNINVGALNTNVWSYTSINSNTSLDATEPEIYLSTATTDEIQITLPLVNTTTAGRFYIIKDRSGLASQNNLTITPNSTDTINNLNTSEVINYDYGSIILVSDGSSNWNTFREGSPPATTTTLGTIQLAGDLAGSGSSYTAPRVVDATPIQKGKIQLAGDLSGYNTTSAFPKISAISGDATGKVYIGINTNTLSQLASRHNNRLIGTSASSTQAAEEVLISTNQHLTSVTGGIRYSTQTISNGGEWYIDDIIKNTIIFVYPTAVGLTLVLPANQNPGRMITIKDTSGLVNNNVNTLTLRTIDGKTIEGLLIPKQLTTNFGSWSFVSDNNGNWWMV